MAGKKRTDQPRDIGDDQQAGMHPGENFQPRNRGEGADAKDRAAAEDETVNPGSLSQTAWEGRVERGEEWMEEQVPEREARGDEEPNSEVSRRGLVNPPPEE